MNGLTEFSNLAKYIVEPVRKILGKKLETYFYYDSFKEDDLMTNKMGVDIISHQLELKFEGSAPIFISWETIDGWFQYSLCVSEIPFCKGVEKYTKYDSNWEDIVGKALKRFEIYGYKEHVITSTEKSTRRTRKETYYNEPHLLIFHFENEKLLGFSNFYLEEDFEPNFPMGDDVWIIFEKNRIDGYIDKLSLEILDY